MEPAVYTPVSAAANLRRSVIVSIVLAVVAIIVTSVAGHPLMGIFGAVGLALGAVNNRMLQLSVLEVRQRRRHDHQEAVQPRRASPASAAITLIAIGCGVLLRPDGLGVFAGLAVFQILMLVGAAVPVFRSLRPTS